MVNNLVSLFRSLEGVFISLRRDLFGGHRDVGTNCRRDDTLLLVKGLVLLLLVIGKQLHVVSYLSVTSVADVASIVVASKELFVNKTV